MDFAVIKSVFRDRWQYYQHGKKMLYGPNVISSDIHLHSTRGKFIIQIYEN